MKPMITHADDFGASPGTNAAIIDAVRAGFVRNVGVMAVGPYLTHRIDELRELSSVCCIGLHAVANSEWDTLRWGPALGAIRAPSLVRPDGTFFSTVAETTRHAVAGELLAELDAQLSRLRALGLNPRYLDTHMRFNECMRIDGLLEQFCLREQLMFRAGSHLPSFRPPRKPDWLKLDGDAMAELIARLPSLPHAWCFHPAHLDDVSKRFVIGRSSSTCISEIAWRRAREAELLCDARWVEAVRAVAEPLRHDELVPGLQGASA